MSAKLRIQDGSPVWLSPSIVPSKDIVSSPNSSPSLATIQVSSNDVFVYVNVENTGTVDVGLCSCSAQLPAAWASTLAFSGFLDSTTQSLIDNRGAFVFDARPSSLGADRIIGPGLNIGFPFGNGRRAWGWSPDGRMFAYVYEPGNSPSGSGESSWYMAVYALQPVTLSDGTTAPIRALLAVANGTFDWRWTQDQFGWAGSQAVVAHGAAWDQFAHFFYGAPQAAAVTIVCPLYNDASHTNGGATWSGTKSFSTVITGNPPFTPPIPHQDRVAWIHLVSPCGSYVAVVPRILDPSAPPQTIVLVATVNAQEVTFRRNNVALLGITSTGTNPSITTNTHTANGVTIDTGNGTTVDVDDPECTFIGGGVVVHVDRVKASTLPTANLGVLPVGTAVLGTIRQNVSSWVQVPNQNGWANQSEKHWCLLAQTYTADGTTIPRSWDGQATNPPQFPTANENCAQRNIEINP